MGTIGCGSGGASPTAGPSDLFLCDNPWYKDETGDRRPSANSSTMIGAIKPVGEERRQPG